MPDQKRSEAARRAARTRKKNAAAKKKAAQKKARPNVPSGGRLTAAQQGLRDSLMVARRAQGWTWEEVAEEAGVTPTTAQRAVASRAEAMPLNLNMDPAEIVERTFEGFQLSIADFERLAVDAAGRNNLAVAVGAKKAANDAREKTVLLLQATNRLPQELGALRHLIDMRAIALKMLDTMDRFQAAARALEMSQEDRALLDAEVGRVRATFGDLIGLERTEEIEATAA